MNLNNSAIDLESLVKEEIKNEENIRRSNGSCISFPSESHSSVSKHNYKNSLSTRKELPQTSILVSTSRNKIQHQNHEHLLSYDFGCSPLGNTETEIISIQGSKKITVSKRVGFLLSELLNKFPNCRVIQDVYYGEESDVFKYLYDSKLNPIKSINDLWEFPLSVVISCRHTLTNKNSPCFQSGKRSNSKACASFQTIDLYKSIITKKPHHSERKFHKRELFILKKLPPKQIKIIDSQPSLQRKQNMDSYHTLIPIIGGKKVIEGTAGFQKPHLLFENHKTNQKNIFLKNSEKRTNLQQLSLKK